MAASPPPKRIWSERPISKEDKDRADEAAFRDQVGRDRVWGPVQGIALGVAVVAFLLFFVLGWSRFLLFVVGIGLLVGGIAAMAAGETLILGVTQSVLLDNARSRRARREVNRVYTSVYGVGNIFFGVIALIAALFTR